MSSIEDKAIALIMQHGLFGLCESDGCPCCNFSVHNVEVGVSCRKSEKCVRVESHSMDYDPPALEKVMRAVLQELQKEDSTEYRIRFCDYQSDHHRTKVNGSWIESCLCCYCSKPRAGATGYLCNECKAKPDAVGRYPWTGDGFMAAG